MTRRFYPPRAARPGPNRAAISNRLFSLKLFKRVKGKDSPLGITTKSGGPGRIQSECRMDMLIFRPHTSTNGKLQNELGQTI